MAEFMADDPGWLRSLAHSYPGGPQRARLLDIAGAIEDTFGDPDSSEVARITIVKTVDETDQTRVSISNSEGLTYLDALGLLAYATRAANVDLLYNSP